MDMDDILKPHHLDWFDMYRSIDGSAIEQLPQILQNGIDMLADEFDEHIAQETARMSPEEAAEYADFASEHHWELSIQYPSLMRRALLMMTFAKFEYTLHDLCEAAYLDGKSRTQAPSEVYVGQSEEYIKTTLGISDASLDADWIYIHAVRNMRNNFVHSDGRLGTDNQGTAVRTFIANNPSLGLEIDSNDLVVLGDNTVELIARKCQTTISTLLARIRSLPDLK